MSPRVLLVDDDADIRAIARLSLERIGGWDVVEADGGEAALAAATCDGPFDAVLLDVMMPGLDGPSTLARLRDGRLPETVPVMFLTAKSQRSERERLLALGAAETIAKPFDPASLPAQLARACAPS
jgi:two-component system, OmpR family, response regulator